MTLYFFSRLAEEIARTKLQSNLNAVAPNVYSLSCHNSTVALHEVGDYNVCTLLLLAEVSSVCDENLVLFYIGILRKYNNFELKMSVHIKMSGKSIMCTCR